ncbi:MAG TPA: 1-deoxy-D-xylulose-5-phosphate synthase N-terminal domain-containing protein [Nocardioides sp.]|uniref:transketolase-like TK C-terminal-containing protein n=1 Tax=uncultured Nocardioides sp. TaxID=198441 RepID=UPI000ECB0756|nr:1-deoxy-D-xylulose-5-phosphate synthase N-terminal domain-containing protein [uncultured Nocardioides sp.]HCB05406.1 pyruvate dehydrogenase [Nocardioides sp.]HRI94759.1 1-deoxy-D-xylulose-5-phosphate synthase N-terminal domain-containing protein [Nocardioides sp.]HRK44568.1 1-deoxy-D-xylulose-5-phosphate synthase N-terminal domain-containing protein [Nocardioides sp.]
MSQATDVAPTVISEQSVLREIAQRVLWLSTAIVDAANRGRPNATGVKVGGHQASSASMVDMMVALWFHELTAHDRVSVKPHASPVLHAINYLLEDLDQSYLTMLRTKGGLQSYPSRLKDPDTVDFSTGSVGIGATAALWAAMAHRYSLSHFEETPPAGRFVSLIGDAELDEGAIWEAVADPAVASLGELLWIVDLNRQSLDRVVPDIQIARLQGMFAAAGWQVVTLKWGRRITELFERPGGAELRARLEQMPNEEYQRMLRVGADDVANRILAGGGSHEFRTLVEGLDAPALAAAIRDLGGHDLGLLVDTFGSVETDRPTVVFAYTVKGRGLPTEGHPNNHSALLNEAQMIGLADACGTSLTDPWRKFEPGTSAAALCDRRARDLRRMPVAAPQTLRIPTSLGHQHRKAISTQAALGRLLADLTREVPEAAARVVTCSPDVASSTNLGGWINKTGVWSANERTDWFADDGERLLKWSETVTGQHIELGIAEVNLVGLLGELGATWSRWGQRLIPVATLYDPFVSRALEPWSYGIYAGGQSILVGTPSGITLAPEGGAHQSITTPSIGLEQPGCVAWEPAFPQDLEWTFLHAMSQVGIPGGTSAYFRLSTRPLDPLIAQVPDDPTMRERRRQQVIAGGYRLTHHDPLSEHVTLVGVGAIMPEVVAAAKALESAGIVAGVVCLTSPDLVFRSFQQRGRREAGVGGDILSQLFPAEHPVPLVTILDGHPHTLSFLAGARGDQVNCLGVSEFGQSSNLTDAYALHRLDAGSIVDAALNLLSL